MDHNNNSHNHPQISSDPFEFEPVILDDELLQLINSAVVSPDNRSGDRTGLITANNTTSPAPPQEPAVPPQRTEAAAPGKKGKGKAKSNATRLNATEVERERRHVMSSLYQDLRSLLPPQNVKRRKSISNLLEDAINHINSMQVGINQLNEKKERLRRIRSTPSSSSCNVVINNSSNQQKNQVTVKPCKEGIVEITVDTIKNATCNNNNNNNNNNEEEEEENGLISLPLSKVLQLLSEENLNVINCVSSRVDDSLVHNIQVQVDDGRTVDLGLLQQTLNHRYS